MFAQKGQISLLGQIALQMIPDVLQAVVAVMQGLFAGLIDVLVLVFVGQ